MVFKLPQLKLNRFIILSFLLFSLMLLANIGRYFVVYPKTEDDCVPRRLQMYLEVEDVFNISKYNTDLKLEVLLANLKERNKQCEVRNLKKFGPITPGTPTVVVTVRRDLERLQHLVLSLAQVADIQMLLLIFSHSFYDEQINHFIRKIDFCMVLQIFYPNSLQLHPNSLSNKCTERTLHTNGSCTERDIPTEPKHHWWWTANFVFDQLPWTETHEDMVIFIDEKSYVLPDFLYMFRMLKNSLAYVPDASVLSFGRPLAGRLHYDKLIVEAWRPAYKELAFNKTTWRKISSLGTFYCQYDDTSWSYSLMYLFERFPRGHAVMVASVLPRVVATGMFRSGRHALQNICWMTSRDQLYPKKVHVVMIYGREGRVVNQHKAPPTGNGGWSDQLDHQLCLYTLSSPTSDEPITTAPTVTDKHSRF